MITPSKQLSDTSSLLLSIREALFISEKALHDAVFTICKVTGAKFCTVPHGFIVSADNGQYSETLFTYCDNGKWYFL